MKNIYQNILATKQENKKLLAILIDPDKTKVEEIENLSQKINQSPATHIFIGGSIVEQICIDSLIIEIKKYCHLPILIFPGHPSQISNEADGILFLSLLSGRNPDYLIEHHINSVDILTKSTLEIISTGYILIDGGNETAVQRVSQTLPIENTNINLAYKTAKAGEYLGKKLIYLEAALSEWTNNQGNNRAILLHNLLFWTRYFRHVQAWFVLSALYLYHQQFFDDGSKNPALTQKIVDSVSRLSEKDQKFVLEISERLGKD